MRKKMRLIRLVKKKTSNSRSTHSLYPSNTSPPRAHLTLSSRFSDIVNQPLHQALHNLTIPQFDKQSISPVHLPYPTHLPRLQPTSPYGKPPTNRVELAASR